MGTVYELRVPGHDRPSDRIILGRYSNSTDLVRGIMNAFENHNANPENLYVNIIHNDDKENSIHYLVKDFLIKHVISLQSQIDDMKKKLDL